MVYKLYLNETSKTREGFRFQRVCDHKKLETRRVLLHQQPKWEEKLLSRQEDRIPPSPPFTHPPQDGRWLGSLVWLPQVSESPVTVLHFSVAEVRLHGNLLQHLNLPDRGLLLPEIRFWRRDFGDSFQAPALKVWWLGMPQLPLAI